ncbi:UDP-glucose dehydrogenase family protein [Neomoorella mulderi]|uniref:UDP-glucose 6-dehydrogenase n=1 Tax=Moorella mulderi DSM 14980 TaxID=1122241 RepID=A0A151AYT6_9FIRM|nr:UDP-glucose/GDP-mannose dehydrogenase family protein [Moorella mulderi]KYH32824.1 UDP-glucose 6-dehydrogenase TuaD [Moorella mulderi DSM 14980]
MELVIIGSGYVGLVAACCLAHSGHKVITVEKNIGKLEKLQRGVLPIYEEGLEELFRQGVNSSRLFFSEDLRDVLPGVDFIMIAVGTPSLADGRVDLAQVYEVAQTISETADHPLVVVMKSTVPPGTGKYLIERFFSKACVPIRYVSNPEFLREGKAVWDWYHPDRIVVGSDDPVTAEEVLELYSDIDAPKVTMDVTSAEMVKYASNAFLATKISFINEVANLCELVGADIKLVASAVGMDKRIGPHFLQAGLGYGGSCFPKDTKGLDYISSFNGYSFNLLKAVIEVNSKQRILAVRKLHKEIGNLAGKKIAVLGLAFKPGTDDVREAPALDIIKYLVDEGAAVAATDPLALKNAYPLLPSCVKLSADPYEVLVGAQAFLLATEWPQLVNLDWERVKRLMREPFLVVDGRNALDARRLVGLGYRYCGFGRPGNF